MVAARVTRRERYEQFKPLRDQGLTLREIAASFDVSPRTVSDVLNDPDRAKVRARRERYRGRCAFCGKPTSGAEGRSRAPTRCRDHPDLDAQMKARGVNRWTRETVISELQRLGRELGRAPAVGDYFQQHGRSSRPVVVEGMVGIYNAARCLFGSWNNALTAAGFEPRLKGHRAEPERWLRNKRAAEARRARA